MLIFRKPTYFFNSNEELDKLFFIIYRVSIKALRDTTYYYKSRV